MIKKIANPSSTFWMVLLPSTRSAKKKKIHQSLPSHNGLDGIDAEWHFFCATSHGKWPCDGIGGTVKRLPANDSLQRPYCEQS